MNKFEKCLFACLDFLFKVFILYIFLWIIGVVMTMTISLPKTSTIIVITSVCIAIIDSVCDYYKNRKNFLISIRK